MAVSFLAIGPINTMHGNATIKPDAQFFNHIWKNPCTNSKFKAVISNERIPDMNVAIKKANT